MSLLTIRTKSPGKKTSARNKRRRLRLRLSGPLKWALLFGLLCTGLSWNAAPPQRAATLAAGFGWGLIFGWGLGRMRKTKRALRGQPLAEDDLKALRNRPSTRS